MTLKSAISLRELALTKRVTKFELTLTQVSGFAKPKVRSESP
jgi:hypothetical protein